MKERKERKQACKDGLNYRTQWEGAKASKELAKDTILAILGSCLVYIYMCVYVFL